MLYVSCRDLLQLLGPDTLDPALLFRKMPIRSHCLYFAVYHDRLISVSFLDRRRGREKLNIEVRTIESHDLGYDCIRLSKSFRQICTSQVFSVLASQLSYVQLSRSNRHIFSRDDRRKEESYDLGYHRIRLSESFRQTCTCQVFSLLASQLLCIQLSQSNRQIFSKSKQCSL